MMTLRDIDYAADAVRTSMLDKFGRSQSLGDLRVEALDRTIRVSLNGHSSEGTRDELMSRIRRTADLSGFWSRMA
jgi:hypothetical protein